MQRTADRKQRYGNSDVTKCLLTELWKSIKSRIKKGKGITLFFSILRFGAEEPCTVVVWVGAASNFKVCSVPRIKSQRTRSEKLRDCSATFPGDRGCEELSKRGKLGLSVGAVMCCSYCVRSLKVSSEIPSKGEGH